MPSLPQPLGDSDVSTYYLHILGLHYNCAGFRWFHAFQVCVVHVVLATGLVGGFADEVLCGLFVMGRVP